MVRKTLKVLHQSSATGVMGALAAISAHGDPVALEPLLRTEWAGLWTMLVLSLANIVLAVWRPTSLRGAS